MAGLVTGRSATAQTSGSWIANAPGNWSSAANWQGGSIPDAGGTATFAFPITTAVTVTLDSNRTVGGLQFTNTGSNVSYTLAGTSTLTFSAAGALTFGTAAPTTISAPIALTGGLTVNGLVLGTSGAPQTVSSVISGTGPLTIGTTTPHIDSGPLALTGANTFTGDVILQSGLLRVGNAAALGAATNILKPQGGILQQGAAVTLPNPVDTTGANLIASSSGGTLTLGGIISGANGVISQQRGGSSLILTGANTYTGQTISRLIPIDVTNGPSAAGPLVLSGGGTALQSSGFVMSGGARLVLDNSTVGTSVARIGGSAPVALNNGVFQLNGSTGTSTTQFLQQAGALTGTGYNVVSLNSQAATTEGVAVQFASINRGTTGTFLFTAGSASTGAGALGAADGAVNTQRILFTAAPTLVGATDGSGFGTAGSPGIGVIPWAVGGNTLASPGANASGSASAAGLVTYTANGVRVLDPTTEYTLDAFTANTNVRLVAAGTVAAGGATINSLYVNGQSTVSGGPLTISSGLVVSSNAPTISNNLTFGAAQANFFTSGGAMIVSGRVSGTGGLVKSGGSSNALTTANALTLSPYNTYTGTTAVNDGYIQLVDPSALGTSTSAVEVNSRGTSSPAGLRGSGSGVAVNFNRPIVSNNGYAGLAAGPATDSRGVFIASGNISGTGGVIVSHTSTTNARGITFLAGTNTQAGSTRVFAGDIAFASDSNLGAASASFDLGAASGVGIVQFGDWTTSRPFNQSSNSLWDTNGFNATLSGPLTNTSASTLIKAGAGTVTLNNLGVSQLSLGTINLTGGGLTLAGNTQLPNLSAAAINLFSGTFRYDNTTTNQAARLGVQSAVRYQNAGSGTFQIDAGTNAVNQTLTSLVIGPGGTATGRVTLTAAAGGSALLTLTSATGYGVLGNNSPSFVLRGEGLAVGTAAVVPGQTGVIFTTAPTEANDQLAGAGGAGTTNAGILRGAVGIVTTGGTPTQIGLLTQTSTAVGTRLLDTATEYAPDFTTALANVRLTASAAAGAATAVNSLSLVGNNVTATLTGGNTLAVRGGTFLATGGTSSIVVNGTGTQTAALSSPAVTAQQSGFIFYVDANSTLTSNATYSGAAGGARVVKNGPGTFVFDPRDASGTPVAGQAAGGTVSDVRVTEGTFAIPAGNSLANLPGNLFLSGGATFQYRGASLATAKSISLNGEGGTLDLAGTVVQFTTAAAAFTNVTASTTYGVGRLAAGTLVLGGGTSGTPAALQTNSFEGGLYVNGGTVVLNADSTLASANTVLGLGTLRLNGGQLAPLYATRSVAVPVEIPAGQNPTFVNNLNLSGSIAALTADTSNSGLTFLAPVRLMGSTTITNSMTGGAVTFGGSVYDNPYSGPATLTLNANSTSGAFVFNAPNAHRGGLVVGANAVAQAGNTAGSATGSGNVTVQVGGTLQGGNAAGTAGFVVPSSGGTVTVNGTLAPGAGVANPGILTVGAPDRTVGVSLTGASSRYVFNLAATNAGSGSPLNDGSSTTAVGTGNNFLRVQSNGSNGSSLGFSPTTFAVVTNGALTNFATNQNFSWQVANLSDGALTPGTPTFDTTAFNGGAGLGGGTFALSVVGQNLYLNFTPVPEPTTVLAVAGLGLAAVRLRRRVG